MVSRVNIVAFQGIDILDIDVQVQMASGLPAFTNVGPIKSMTESFQQARSPVRKLGQVS
jgi:magnesium chelatase family protein